MKDILQDIVAHTHALGVLNLIKVTTDDKVTNFTAVSDSRTVLVLGEAHQRTPEFEGIFGMGNLEKLNLLLKNPEYQEDPKITIMKEIDEDGVEFLSYIHFENMLGDFQNDYRFVNYKIIDKQVKNYKFKGAQWELEFEPPVASIGRLKLMSAIHTEEETLDVFTDNDNLIFSFGDANNHAGQYVFKHNTGNILKTKRSYPIYEILSILTLSGNKTMQISSTEGAMKINVDSGLADYQYIVPIASK